MDRKLGRLNWRFSAVVSLALLLSGCVTWSGLETDLDGFKGRPVQDAFAVLGYPAQQQQFGQDTVYTWASNYTGSMVMPTTTRTTGYVGGQAFSANTSGVQAVPMNFDCSIKLIVDGAGVVQRWQYAGNLNGCEPYMRQLKKASGR